jgi:hypothetical protein
MLAAGAEALLNWADRSSAEAAMATAMAVNVR